MFGGLLNSQTIILWVVVGLLAGFIGGKIFYRRNRIGPGGFGELVQMLASGMAGSAIGIVAGVLLGVPGANVVGLPMLALAVAGTLAIMFVASRFS